MPIFWIGLQKKIIGLVELMPTKGLFVLSSIMVRIKNKCNDTSMPHIVKIK
jgi:hypothetical protein